MARAASLASRSAVNRAKAGGKSGGVKLPYTPPSFNGPPPGTFDPGLEAEVRSSERGLLDEIEKIHLEGKRSGQDTSQAERQLQLKVHQGRQDIARNRTYAQQDAATQGSQLGTSFARDLQDLATAKQQGQEDYEKTLVEMQHKYATQAQQQGETRVATGTDEHGTTAASAAVDAANQAYDKGNVDQVHQRNEAALALSGQRDTENYQRQQGLLAQGLGREEAGFATQGHRLGLEDRTQFKALHLAALRGAQDRATTLSHAKREQGIYSTDVASQAYYQAHQLNPNILFPTPSAAAGLGGSGAPHAPHPPGIGGNGGTAAPHVHSPVPRAGLGPSVSRRPYTRY